MAAYILQKTKHVKRKKKRRNTLSVKYSGKPIQTVGKCRLKHIQEFGSGILSSNMWLITDGGCSLSVKRPIVDRENRVRVPQCTRINKEQMNEE